MSIDVLRLVPHIDIDSPFRSGNVSMWLEDGDLDSFVSVVGAERVAFQRNAGKPLNVLATASRIVYGGKIRSADVYVRLDRAQARDAAQSFGSLCFVHEDDELREALGIAPEVVAA